MPVEAPSLTEDGTVDVVCAGLTTLDLTYTGLPSLTVGAKAQADDCLVSVGGPAANAAIAISDLGGKVSLVSNLGQSELTGVVESELTSHGVDTGTCRRVGTVPVSAVIVTEDGERTVVSINRATDGPVTDNFNGAGGHPEASHPEAVQADPLRARQLSARSRPVPRVILIDGHYPDLVLDVLVEAAPGTPATVIDLGSWKPWLPDLLPQCQFAIASASFRVPGADSQQASIAALLKYGIEFVAFSNGADPIVWYDNRGRTGTIVINHVAARSTNGAGDILHGAFALLLARGETPVDALAQAAAIATRSCKQGLARIAPAEIDTLSPIDPLGPATAHHRAATHELNDDA